MNKLFSAAIVLALCAASYGAGYWRSMQTTKSMVASDAGATAIWRESDWQVSSIRYARIIQLIRSNQDQQAIRQACEDLDRNIKNIRKLRGVIDDPKVPPISAETYEIACK